MSSFKTLFCDICVILLFGLTVAIAEDKPSGPIIEDAPTGNCSCGGFATLSPTAETAPLLSQSPGLIVKCDDEGMTTCQTLCHALATATKAKGPEILCNKLKEANELKLSAFSKVCDMPWAYANITAEEPLCCDGGKVNQCPTLEKINTTTSDVIDAKIVM